MEHGQDYGAEFYSVKVDSPLKRPVLGEKVKR